jgi:hypothetical protein
VKKHADRAKFTKLFVDSSGDRWEGDSTDSRGPEQFALAGSSDNLYLVSLYSRRRTVSAESGGANLIGTSLDNQICFYPLPLTLASFALPSDGDGAQDSEMNGSEANSNSGDQDATPNNADEKALLAIVLHRCRTAIKLLEEQETMQSTSCRFVLISSKSTSNC